MVLLASYSEKLEKLSSEKLPNPVPFFILTAENRADWHILKGNISKSNHHIIEEVVAPTHTASLSFCPYLLYPGQVFQVGNWKRLFQRRSTEMRDVLVESCTRVTAVSCLSLLSYKKRL